MLRIALQAQRLNFPLLTDQSEFLRKSFGIKSDWLGMLPGRQTYVIDKAGKVVLSFNDQVGNLTAPKVWSLCFL